jgi:hypothetical protein
MKNQIVLPDNMPTVLLKKMRHSFFSRTTWGMILLLAVFSWQCKRDTFTGEVKGLCPLVTSTTPANGDTNVITNTRVRVTFNEQMRAASINGSNFFVKQGANLISGSISYFGNTATFNPTSYLAINTMYTATMLADAKDLAGNAVTGDYVWTFTTGSFSGPNQPQVVSTDPPNLANSVALNKVVAVLFNKPMNPATMTAAFTLKHGPVFVTGVVNYSGNTATFTPSAVLTANTTYTGMVSTAARDAVGNPLAANYTWNFTTGAAADTLKPTVISTDPTNGASAVLLNKIITAGFSKSMDPNTINATTFTLKTGVTGITGAVGYSGTTASFTPNVLLTSSTTYTATISTGAKDLSGNTLASNYVWTFMTGAATGQPTVNLGSAGNFAILGGSGLTSTGLTIITGDAGTSPTGTVNGFPPGIINGTIHAADAIASQAKLDLTTAYNDAQSRSTNAISLPGDMSGLTFAPGLYVNSSSVLLSAGAVTLDGQGDVNAVFIFKAGSTLTTMAGTQVILAGGAQAKNIFWSVGSSATLGTNSDFSGTLLSDQSISLNTGATLHGRALTRIGAITLQANQVIKP